MHPENNGELLLLLLLLQDVRTARFSAMRLYHSTQVRLVSLSLLWCDVVLVIVWIFNESGKKKFD